MELSVDSLIKLVEVSPSPIMTLLVLVMAGLYKLGSIFEFFEKNRHAKLKNFNNAIDDGNFEDFEAEYIKELKSQELFKACTGLRANKKFRLSMIKIISESEGTLSIQDFVFAKHLLLVKNGKISIIEQTKMQIFFQFFNYFIFGFSVLSIVFAVIILIYLYLSNEDLGLYIAILLISAINTFSYLNEVMAYNSAKKIKPFLH